jgi:Protein of unknown function (DUF1579)
MITQKNDLTDTGKCMHKEYLVIFPKLFASITLLITITLSAQNKTDSSVLDYSRPGKYHRILADLAGEWTFKGRHLSGNPDHDSSKVTLEFNGSLVRKSFANGRFFIVELTGGKLQIPIQDGKMKEENAQSIETEGYDNVKKKFVLTFINNHIGSGIVFSEGGYDSTTRTIIYESEVELMPERKMKVRKHFIIHDNDHYTLKYYRERDGKDFYGTITNYTRIKGK